MSDTLDLGPLPKTITGSCQCKRIAYKVDFGENHSFTDASGTCQCTQCRRSTSCLFFVYHKVPYSSLTWTTPTDTIKNYYCTEGNARGFCAECGTFLYWRRETGPNISIAIGTNEIPGVTDDMRLVGVAYTPSLQNYLVNPFQVPMAETDLNRSWHAKVGSWFLGPRAENLGLLRDMLNSVLTDHAEARRSLFPHDPAFILRSMQSAESFTYRVGKFKEDVRELSRNLAKHSTPIWSPRYNGHMSMDTTLAGIVGYVAAMLHNPNNVGTEGSALTSQLEKEVGEDLCRMLGYYKNRNVTPWGHLTSGGSVANLEATWAFRNLKFYPLSLREATLADGPLSFLQHSEPPFEVETSQGVRKQFTQLSVWELLNLKPSTVLELPTRLAAEYFISSTFLQSALNPYLVQTTGKDVLEAKYGIPPGKVLLGATKHYSWPKNGAISGIGSANFIEVSVDEQARLDTEALRALLDTLIRKQIPVFAVVAIAGSTEHGACDPVSEIVQIREEYEKRA
ncbi:unnamed protein product [Parascedosporium putredinis]|uniref:CENP-V/GFA domain-containing protein n=1 Tax=Parascedosporium putredinis TaxID=1442378 RepID=A0A9P1H3Z6_9PEZI|nr:unnamed protein product [Parascedosporium putredinis]CAI7996160.1 unnamed protein product [Parascedosporium putredinis]